MIQFRLAREYRLLIEQFSHNTAHTPHVHCWAIGVSSEQQFRWSIPQRDDVVGVVAALRADRSSESKVSELEHTLVVDQQVRGFDVAVQHVVAVQIVQTFEQLLHVALDVLGSEPLCIGGLEGR